MVRRYGLVLMALAGVLSVPATVLAHEGGLLTPADWWSHWSWEPSILLAMVLTMGIYARGVDRLWLRGGVGRGVSKRQVAAFAGGMLAVFVALVSPLDALAGSLFSAHMGQHVVLILVAAPLLAYGLSPVPMLWGLPERWRGPLGAIHQRRRLRKIWRLMTAPLPVWILNTAVLWAWHLPGPYQAAVETEWIHALEHFSFLGAGLLYWWRMMHPVEGMGHGVGILSLFGTTMQSGLLGALITLAHEPWYPVYAGSTAPWGLTPLEDQQLAGIIMWLPGGAFYVAAAGAVFAAWFSDMERRMEDRERRMKPRRSETVQASSAGTGEAG